MPADGDLRMDATPAASLARHPSSGIMLNRNSSPSLPVDSNSACAGIPHARGPAATGAGGRGSARYVLRVLSNLLLCPPGRGGARGPAGFFPRGVLLRPDEAPRPPPYRLCPSRVVRDLLHHQ